ncbi:MAG: MFS transporter [Halothermotrichaceae bacterium]
MKNYRKKITGFSLLQWFFWGSWATYGAYIVYYLSDMGYSNTEIGTIISIRTLLGLIGEPLLGYICDFYNTNKKVFIIGLLCIAVVILPFPYYNWWLILIATGIIGFFWAPQQSILDSWILKSSKKLSDNYGFMRAWGSVGFALTVIIFGKSVDTFGWKILFITHFMFLVIATVIAFFISDTPHISPEKNMKTDRENKDISSDTNSKNPIILFKNIEYTVIVLSAIFIFIPNNIILIFLPQFIKRVGGTPTILGYVLFFNAISEAPIFFLGKYMLRKFKPVSLLFIASCIYVLRVIIAFEAVSPGYFLIFGALQSLSYGVLLITARFYINIIAPDSLRTSAQSILTMAAFGVGGIIASLTGGVIMDVYGMIVLYRSCLFLSLTGVLLMAGLLFYKRVLS